MRERMQFDTRLIRKELDSQSLGDLHGLSALIFGNVKLEYLQWRMANMPDLSLFQASTSGILVGFKAGYAVTENRYYSWLGGVHPDFLRRGIASLLMQEQHDWLKQSAYDVVETHVRQDNSAMIALNLKYGFDITGMFMKAAEPNYIMQLKVNE